MEAEDFNKLPRKCQEMFFQVLNCTRDYSVFDIVGFYNDFCESPIEQIFSMAFNIINFLYYNDILRLDEQAEINTGKKTYRVDFLFDSQGEFSDFYTCQNNFKLVIECDGHEFHHATKEQVKRDNERQMNLKKAGYDIIRFSGTQLYEDPWKCAEDAIEYILSNLGGIKNGGGIDKFFKKDK